MQSRSRQSFFPLLYFQAAACFPSHTTHMDLNLLWYECAAALDLVTALFAADFPSLPRLAGAVQLPQTHQSTAGLF